MFCLEVLMAKNADLCDARTVHPEKIALAKKCSLEESEINLLTRTFKAMGDPTRMRILWALGNQELCVCDLRQPWESRSRPSVTSSERYGTWTWSQTGGKGRSCITASTTITSAS